MRATTLWQPYASLIAWGVKFRETRSYAPPGHLLGQRIAIHAAKRMDLSGLPPLQTILPPEAWDEGLLPSGAVVATALLADCIPTRDITDPDPYGNYGPGRWAWILEDIERLEAPVPARGYQGFWRLPWNTNRTVVLAHDY